MSGDKYSRGGVVEGSIPETLMVRYNDVGRREYWDTSLKQWVLILLPSEVKAICDPEGIALVQAIHDRKADQ